MYLLQIWTKEGNHYSKRFGKIEHAQNEREYWERKYSARCCIEDMERNVTLYTTPENPAA